MFCNKCGNILPDNAKFCTSCGAPIESGSKVNTDCDHDHFNSYTPAPAVTDVVTGSSTASVGFVEAVVRFFTKYADFSGRARRSEYWWVMLMVFGVNIVLNMLDIQLLSGIWSLGILVPLIALNVRRLHDVGKPGTWYLWIFLPVAGWIIILLQTTKDSDPAANMYGPNPKAC